MRRTYDAAVLDYRGRRTAQRSGTTLTGDGYSESFADLLTSG